MKSQRNLLLPGSSLEGVYSITGPPSRLDTRGLLSLSTMFVSLFAMSVSMFGAARLVVDIFDDGLVNALEGIMVKVMVLALSFFFGWIMGLVSIRGFGNLVFPILIRFYAWFCLAAVGILYLKVIQKLYLQKYDGLHFWAYLIILLGGLFVLISLHLLVEGHDLRPFAIPLLVISALQLLVIVSRYVFSTNPNGWMLVADFTIFFIMTSISALMLMHIGILSPLRDQITRLFHPQTTSEISMKAEPQSTKDGWTRDS
ncbi:MAG: hypothetical protein FJZ87_11315 [Chloroflexi bacterium]|nr:hypothetical protein [Chloroflexota bacterium]